MTEPQTGILLSMEAWTEGRMMLTDAQKENLRLRWTLSLNTSDKGSMAYP